MSPKEPMHVAKTIEARLTERFSPTYLDVEDVSWQHAGHAGARPGGQSHFELTITAEELTALGSVAAHRLIHQTLADLLAGPVHALQIRIKKR